MNRRTDGQTNKETDKVLINLKKKKSFCFPDSVTLQAHLMHPGVDVI
jgi:hypothetical protein